MLGKRPMGRLDGGVGFVGVKQLEEESCELMDGRRVNIDICNGGRPRFAPALPAELPDPADPPPAPSDRREHPMYPGGAPVGEVAAEEELSGCCGLKLSFLMEGGRGGSFPRDGWWVREEQLAELTRLEELAEARRGPARPASGGVVGRGCGEMGPRMKKA